MIVCLQQLRKKRAGWRAKQGRFWKPSDEQNQQREMSNEIQFLYPSVRQFPFDSSCEQIVRELEKRNWKVPGISVEFHEYGSGAQKFRMISWISSRDFKMWFCRVQRHIPGGRWNDTAGVSKIVIPKKELNVYEDESGPTFYLYVGDDYQRDREMFMNGSKVNSKLHREKKIFLEYTGSCDCESGKKFSLTAHTHSRLRSPLLVHTNDLGRQYDPEGDEPKAFKTVEVMKEFKIYLEEVVLQTIKSHLIPTQKIDMFVAPQPIPFPESVGSLFCFGEYSEAERIKKGKENPYELEPADRYALSADGYRLVSLDTPRKGKVPKIAYEGFRWCGMGETTSETAIELLHIPGHYRGVDQMRFVLRIKPNRANDIFIADHAQYEKRRTELGEAMEEGRSRYTDAEVADFVCARGRTIIPISKYKGGYEQPIVLINRELSFDEVEIVSGPHNGRYERK